MTPQKRIDELVRSERHFTSGLLMHVLLHDALRGVDRFLELLVDRGMLPELPVLVPSQDVRTQVVAEFAARRDVVAAGGAIDYEVPRDVVDVVIVAGTTLVALEAKFFTRPTLRDVRDQLATQRLALAPIAADPAYGITRIVQLFIEHGRELPASEIGCDGVLTWEDIHGMAARMLGQEAYVSRQIASAMKRCENEFQVGVRGEVFWDAAVSFDEAVALCQRCGDEVLMGFTGGEAALRATPMDVLMRRRWKSCRPGTGGSASNWIPGTRFLELLARIDPGK
ncbi:MAG: hypothetical protein WCJ30_05635 [Deltaproteobacteria bacterium]